MVIENSLLATQRLISLIQLNRWQETEGKKMKMQIRSQEMMHDLRNDGWVPVVKAGRLCMRLTENGGSVVVLPIRSKQMGQLADA